MEKTVKEETTERNSFQVLTVIQSVVLSAFFLETSVSFVKGGISLSNIFLNFRAITQLIALLIFLELYIVLDLYHHDLGVRYKNLFLFYDLLFLAFPFIVLIELIKYSWENMVLFHSALIVFMVIFGLLLVRQLISYRSIPAGKVKLGGLFIPMIADVVGIALCGCALASLDNQVFGVFGITGWSWVGLVVLIIYLSLVRVWVVQLR